MTDDRSNIFRSATDGEANRPLNPRDPKVFGDSKLIATLPPADRMIADVERAQHGMEVDESGNFGVECMLIRAGVKGVNADGVLNGHELEALKRLKEERDDTKMLKAICGVTTALATTAVVASHRSFMDALLGRGGQEIRIPNAIRRFFAPGRPEGPEQ